MIFNLYSDIKILVIEDEGQTRELICRALREIGVKSVTTAVNAKDGLQEVVRVQPDLIFCDIHMNGGDGHQFLRVLRSTKVRDVGQTPVVFLTADSQAESVKLAHELGVTGYLVKPVRIGKLRERIDAMLATRPTQP